MKVSQLPYRRVTREEMTAGLRHVIERVRGARNVEEILEARAEYLSLKTEYDTAQSLSYMRYTINTVDPFYLAEKDYYDEIGPEIENLDLQYASAVLDSPFRAGARAGALADPAAQHGAAAAEHVAGDRGRHGRGEQARQRICPAHGGHALPLPGRTAAAPDADEIRPQRRPRHAQSLL